MAAFDRAGQAADPPPRGRWQFNRGACLYELGRFAEAEAAFLAAAEAEPSLAGAALANAGFAALDAGAAGRARELAGRARAAGGADDLASDLAALLDEAEGAPAGAAWKVGGSAHLGAGFDGNVLQSGTADRETVAGGLVRSAFAAAGLGLRLRAPLGGRWTGEASYALEQLAYAAAEAEDQSLQEHSLSLGLERKLGARVRAGARGVGSLAFTGLSSFRGLVAAAGGRAWAAVDEGAGLTGRLELGLLWKRGLRPEFEYLGGSRLDLSASQELRWGRLVLGLGGAWRVERLGTFLAGGSWTLPAGACASGACTETYSIPVGQAAGAVTLSARAALRAGLTLAGAAGVEWRRSLGESALLVEDGGVTRALDRRRRQDRRLSASLALLLRPRPWLELALRGELTANGSNVARSGSREECLAPAFRCHALDHDDKRYLRAVASADAAVRW